MQLDEGTTADVLARLRRIQGQVGGIIRMVEAGRGCREVVQQISAAGRALDQTGFKILASGLRNACRTSRPPNRPATAKTSWRSCSCNSGSCKAP